MTQMTMQQAVDHIMAEIDQLKVEQGANSVVAFLIGRVIGTEMPERAQSLERIIKAWSAEHQNSLAAIGFLCGLNGTVPPLEPEPAKASLRLVISNDRE